jgi:hypothetical protein
MLTCCLVLPTITRRFYVLVPLVSLGLPWSTVDFFSSEFDLLQSQLPIPSRHPIGIKNVARSKCRSYCRHTRFKSPQRPGLCKVNKDICSWALLPSLLPHIPLLLHCFPKPPVVSVTCAQVFDILWQETFWDWLLHGFLATHYPSRIIDIYSIFAHPIKDEGVVTVPLKAALISSFEYPYCLSSKTVNSSVIIDSGASVCISPNLSDFITYKDSKMKIKDLSSSNKVAGEGILRWKLQDVNGDSVHVELLGYHIPNAEVCLLSPQVLLQTICGHTLQTVNGIHVVLDNGNNFGATFCPRSNLPMIPLALDKNTKQCFWNTTFGFSIDSFGDINTVIDILHQANTNLS